MSMAVAADGPTKVCNLEICTIASSLKRTSVVQRLRLVASGSFLEVQLRSSTAARGEHHRAPTGQREPVHTNIRLERGNQQTLVIQRIELPHACLAGFLDVSCVYLSRFGGHTHI
jgi:hypothetical protein